MLSGANQITKDPNYAMQSNPQHETGNCLGGEEGPQSPTHVINDSPRSQKIQDSTIFCLHVSIIAHDRSVSISRVTGEVKRFGDKRPTCMGTLLGSREKQQGTQLLQRLQPFQRALIPLRAGKLGKREARICRAVSLSKQRAVVSRRLKRALGLESEQKHQPRQAEQEPGSGQLSARSQKAAELNEQQSTSHTSPSHRKRGILLLNLLVSDSPLQHPTYFGRQDKTVLTELTRTDTDAPARALQELTALGPSPICLQLVICRWCCAASTGWF